jgi:error-prone DNA polymerase
MQPEQAQARALIGAGCCDSLAGELTRPALLWRLYASNKRTPAEISRSFDESRPASPLPIPDEYSEQQRLTHEAETLGFIWTRHPVDLYRAHLRGVQYINACDMAKHVGRQVTMLGWLITEKSVETKDGEPMEFATFEDTTALYDATIFPDAYRRFCHLLVPERPYILRGLIEEHFSTVTITINNLQYLDAGPPCKRPTASLLL